VSIASASVIFFTGPLATISTSPLRKRMRSAIFPMCPISWIAVRLNSSASGVKP
jgi:hypothetical protein